MIYDVEKLPSTRRALIGLVRPPEVPVTTTKIMKQRTYNLIALLNTATPIFRRNDNECSGTKMVIHRVERLKPNDKGAIALMRAQGLAHEVDAFLEEDEANQTKLLLWGRFVPEGGPPVLRTQTFADDLVIDPDVGLTRDQFTEWYFSANYCKQITCGLKLLLDSLLARGDAIVLQHGWFAGLTADHLLTKVERSQMPAGLPLHAFYLVDPALQPEHSHSHHDGAFPLYHQGIGTHNRIPHDVLTLTGRPRSGKGPDVRVHVDPTYRQVMPSVDLPTDFMCYPMGSEGVDKAYCTHGTHAGVLLDPEPFSVDRIEVVMRCIYPDNSPFADEDDMLQQVRQTMHSTLGALAEVMAIR